jgi:hypothetical protein
MADGDIYVVERIAFAHLRKRPGLIHDADCRAAYDRFVSAVGPLTTDNLNGYPAFKVSRLAEEAVCARFENATTYLLELAVLA